MQDTPDTPPGWYAAAGDPPGTQRYWTGTEWQGDPVPTPTSQVASAAGGNGRVPAEWGQRVGAYLIDMLTVFAMYIPLAIVAAIAGAINESLGVIVALLLYLGLIVVAVYVMVWLPGITGQTPGKRIMGLEVVKFDTGEYLGGGGHVLRYFAQIINSLVCYLGWLWPLWDEHNQSLADKIVSSQVVTGKKGGFLPIFPDGKPF